MPVSVAVQARPLTGGTWRIERPRFSPDGQRILFTVGHETRANLYAIPSNGGTPTQLSLLDGFNGGGVWSKDGRSIAFVSTSGGQPQVWTMGANGESPARVSSVRVSDSFELAWLPAGILLHQPGNRNFLALEPVTRRVSPYFGDGSTGWIFSPTVSPDGRQVAVAWSRGQNSGLWLIDARDRSQKLLTRSAMQPIGWSPDGKSVFVVDGKRFAYRDLAVDLGETTTETKIRRVALSGRIDPVVDLPFEEVGGVAISPDTRRLVCSVYSASSDVWLLEPFDPAGSR